jgi:hypothetical protein
MHVCTHLSILARRRVLIEKQDKRRFGLLAGAFAMMCNFIDIECSHATSTPLHDRKRYRTESRTQHEQDEHAQLPAGNNQGAPPEAFTEVSLSSSGTTSGFVAEEELRDCAAPTGAGLVAPRLVDCAALFFLAAAARGGSQ